MAYTVLARRYRSSTFDEVVGQNHIAQTLKKAIASNRIAHAYLFCGTRGTGKTSTARIFAKALNCEKSDGPTTEPCNECQSCKAIARGEDMDVVEIDAASNTGVDNVRDLIENSRFRPARSRYKVYIIDEVHMLSKAAFNALLKTLEEPPDHVKFILATTEAEKVLPTIQSRCQRYDFRNIPTKEIAGHLREIVRQEQIEADDDALMLVAQAGAGSMRDALSLLDRLLSIGEKTLTVEQIEQLLGMPRTQLIVDLGQCIGEGNVAEVLRRTETLIQNGLSPETLVAALIEHFRNLLVLRTCGLRSGLVEVPGINPLELDKQAQLFDPVALTQDITILEELRRLIRTSQASRALLDATLVRLALADQFIAVGEALAQVDGNGSAAPTQKKKSLSAEGSGTAVQQAGSAPRGDGALGRPSAGDVLQPSPAVPPASPIAADAAANTTTTAPAPQSAPAPASEPPPAIAAPISLDIDLEDDDSLPAVGRVWEEDEGPSLSELLKQQRAASPETPPAPEPAPTAEPAAPSASDDANLEPLSEVDVQKLWPMLLSNLQKESHALSALNLARLDRIEQNIAYIRFSPTGETFARMWQNNGKRDLISQVLSSMLGVPTGVVFEVDEAEPEAAATQPAAAQPAAPERPARPAPHRPQPEPPREPVVQDTRTTIPITPDLVEQLKAEPLVAALIDELGGQVVRVIEQ